MKKILITGGTTFVSKFVAKYFVDTGYEVYVLNRNSKPQVHGVKLLKGDRHQLYSLLKGIYFDAVLDITAYNAADIVDLCDALDGFGQYIMISSSAVYPEYEKMPLQENAQKGENKFWGKYGIDKIDAENSLLERVPDAYILRPPYLYGTMNNVYREAFVFDCAKTDRKFYLPKNCNLKLQFFYIKDLCKLIEQIINIKPLEHIINVGNKETVSIREWVTKCYACYGKTPEFVYVDEDIELRDYFPFHNYDYELNVEKQYQIYAETVSLEDGLLESARWYDEHEKEVNKRPYFQFIDEKLS